MVENLQKNYDDVQATSSRCNYLLLDLTSSGGSQRVSFDLFKVSKRDYGI